MQTQALTAKFRLCTTNIENGVLHATMKAYLAACNFVSDYVYTTKDIHAKSVQKAVYRTIRNQFSLPAQMACNVCRIVTGNYKTILSNKQSWTKVVYRHGFYDLSWNRDYSLKKDVLSIGTLQGRLKLKFYKRGLEHYFDGNSKFGAAKVICKKGKFYLLVSVERNIPDPAAITNIVGIDRGINFIAVAYDSKGKTVFFPGRSIKNKRAAYKKVRKELQQRGTKSARRRLKQIGQRENRWMSDINHQVSKALVESNPTGTLFVLEDLSGIRNATERVRKKDRYVQVSWSFHDLGTKLKYKAVRAGSQVIEVNPAYTSQTCPKCGFVHKLNRDKKNHTFQCRTCGYRSNDDRIAAMNLYFKGIQYHSTVTTEQTLL